MINYDVTTGLSHAVMCHFKKQEATKILSLKNFEMKACHRRISAFKAHWFNFLAG